MTESLMTKREQATAILRDLFSNRSRITIAEAVEAGAQVNVSRATLRRAATDLGVREVHRGRTGGIWEKEA